VTVYPLEPDRKDMESMGRAALEAVADFIESLPEAPAVPQDGADDLTEDLTGDVLAGLLEPPPESPGAFGPLLERFREAAAHAAETAGPSYMAYIPGGGLYASALADFLARGFNRYTGFSSFAPALVAMEESTLRWLCDTFGLPATAAGQITTGGSMATLTALVAARHDRLGDDFLDGTLYVTEYTHRSVAKAARVAGFPADRVRTVPTDADLRMDPAAAAEMIARDRAAGLRPFLLAATAGTTDTGAIDPLPELAEVARDNGLWFHVDGAYGGFFHLTERGRERLAGMERADSLILDPHKGLFLPYGTGVLLMRDRSRLHGAFATSGSYLQDAGAAGALPNYADLGPELTRDYRGLRLWLPLHLHGVAAFRAALDEKLDLAEHAYRELAADERLEVPWAPQLSTVAFRLAGDGRGEGSGEAGVEPGDAETGDAETGDVEAGDIDDDRRNQGFLERILAPNRVLLSSTRIAGRYMIRLCVLGHRTHAARVDETIGIIRAAAGEQPGS
jgi:aromatic-L-amino-acid/L-tryptophan decarboxylase